MRNMQRCVRLWHCRSNSRSLTVVLSQQNKRDKIGIKRHKKQVSFMHSLDDIVSIFYYTEQEYEVLRDANLT